MLDRGTHESGRTFDYVFLSPEADARYVVGSVTVYRGAGVLGASDHDPVYVDMRM
jgi:exonuclease III